MCNCAFCCCWRTCYGEVLRPPAHVRFWPSSHPLPAHPPRRTLALCEASRDQVTAALGAFLSPAVPYDCLIVRWGPGAGRDARDSLLRARLPMCARRQRTRPAACTAPAPLNITPSSQLRDAAPPRQAPGGGRAGRVRPAHLRRGVHPQEACDCQKRSGGSAPLGASCARSQLHPSANPRGRLTRAAPLGQPPIAGAPAEKRPDPDQPRAGRHRLPPPRAAVRHAHAKPPGRGAAAPHRPAVRQHLPLITPLPYTAKPLTTLPGLHSRPPPPQFFAMVDFTNPGALGSPADFRRRFEAPILAGAPTHTHTHRHTYTHMHATCIRLGSQPPPSPPLACLAPPNPPPPPPHTTKRPGARRVPRRAGAGGGALPGAERRRQRLHPAPHQQAPVRAPAAQGAALRAA